VEISPFHGIDAYEYRYLFHGIISLREINSVVELIFDGRVGGAIEKELRIQYSLPLGIEEV
jgi:hypothetical protein